MGVDAVPFVGLDSTMSANVRAIAGSERMVHRTMRASRVEREVTVGPLYDGTGGNSRFRVAHGLPGKPDHVFVYVKSIGMFSTTSPNVDSVQSSLVLTQTCYPLSDNKYSYFTVAFPCEIYSESGVVLGAAGNYSRTFNVKVGAVRGALASWYYTATPVGQLREQHVTLGGRLVQILSSAGASDAGEPINYSAFFGVPQNTVVTIEVLSEIRAVYDRSAFAAPPEWMHAHTGT